MPRIIHFELPVDDAERAGKFYAEAFGWNMLQASADEGYWLVTTGTDGPGIDGGFISRKYANELVNIIGVDSIDQSLEKAEAAGAKIVRGKQAVGEAGWAAYIEDTEGNRVGLFESSRKA